MRGWGSTSGRSRGCRRLPTSARPCWSISEWIPGSPPYTPTGDSKRSPARWGYRSKAPLWRPSPPDELLHDPGRPVRRAQRGENRARVHRDRARPVVRIDEVPGQGLDVAVEDQPHELEVLVQERRPRVAPDDVVRRDEIERRGQVEPGRWALPAGRQAPRRLPARRRITVVHAVEGRERHRPRDVVRVAEIGRAHV